MTEHAEDRPWVPFLVARFDEDEAIARGATARREPDGNGGTRVIDVLPPNDPGRVLLERERDRELLELALGAIDGESSPWVGHQIIQQLLAPYRDHPGYDPAWRVSEVPAPPDRRRQG